MKLHHIGIVVPDAKTAYEDLSKFITFSSRLEYLNITSQRVDIQLLQVGDVYIELVTPNSTTSPVSNFAQNGGGFHHVCYEVDDLEKTYSEMVKKGAKPIVRPILGFEERLTTFLFLPLRTMNCNLIELAQKK